MGVKPPAIHFRHTRLYINAGMAFPACRAGAKLLDLDNGRWLTTGDHARVTCKRCLKYLRNRDHQ